jgi:large-conductance mechanosensitive channel
MTIQDCCQKYINNAVDCVNTFNHVMPRCRKVDTVIKVCVAAAVCGIIGGFVSSFLAPIFAVAGGLAAFAYLTSTYTQTDRVADLIKDAKIRFRNIC